MSSSRPSPARISAVCPGSGSLLTPSELSQGSAASCSGYFAPVTVTALAEPSRLKSEK